MEDSRLLFSQESRIRFFAELLSKANCKTVKEFATKSCIPYGRLLLWHEGKRSIPLSRVKQWCSEYDLTLEALIYESLSFKEMMTRASNKGVATLKKKLGKDWSRIIAAKSMEKLQASLKKDMKMRKKWLNAKEVGLRQRFGEDFYHEMGLLGGRSAFKKLGKEALQKHLEKIFRKSFKKRIRFRGMNLRSRIELEVAELLYKKQLDYCYEKNIMGYYPDFFIESRNMIIEAFGFEWKPHIERTVEKAQKFSHLGYKVVVYTYPNLVKYFDGLPVEIVADKNSLEKLLT